MLLLFTETLPLISRMDDDAKAFIRLFLFACKLLIIINYHV